MPLATVDRKCAEEAHLKKRLLLKEHNTKHSLSSLMWLCSGFVCSALSYITGSDYTQDHLKYGVYTLPSCILLHADLLNVNYGLKVLMQL